MGFGDFLHALVPKECTTTTPHDCNLPPRPPLTYSSLTFEFLASFAYTPLMECSFRIFNHNHTLSLREVNAIFGWDQEAPVTELTNETCPGYIEDDWWKSITDGTTSFIARKSKASEIHNACLRYSMYPGQVSLVSSITGAAWSHPKIAFTSLRERV